jgi:hypothetical protein
MCTCRFLKVKVKTWTNVGGSHSLHLQGSVWQIRTYRQPDLEQEDAKSLLTPVCVELLSTHREIPEY